MKIRLFPKAIRKAIARSLFQDFFFEPGRPGKQLMEQLRQLSPDERLFFARCFRDMHRSHAQLFQDLWVVQETGEKRGGFFVEFGATNGVDLSNTYLLESEYAWEGILAEPNPRWHEALNSNRTAKISTNCVYSRTGERLVFLDAPMPELGGIANLIKKSKRDRWSKVAPSFEVETIALNDLLVKSNAPRRLTLCQLIQKGANMKS